jgi:hypothetical protein
VRSRANLCILTTLLILAYSSPASSAGCEVDWVQDLLLALFCGCGFSGNLNPILQELSGWRLAYRIPGVSTLIRSRALLICTQTFPSCRNHHVTHRNFQHAARTYPS